MLKVIVGKFFGLASLMALVSTAAFANGPAVAIVYNPNTGVFGAYHGASNRQSAEQGALNACGGSCTGVSVYALENRQSVLIETWSLGGWVALARGHNNSTWGTSGFHNSQRDAEQSALNNCGGPAAGCYILRSLSSFQNGQDNGR